MPLTPSLGSLGARALDLDEPTKGYIVDLTTPGFPRLVFQYNPEKITDTQSLNNKEVVVVGLSHPQLKPVTGSGRIIDISLLFHWTSRKLPENYVKQQVAWLLSMTRPTKIGDSFQYPLAQFVFGELYEITVRLMDIKSDFPGRFSRESLLPWRAEVAITMKEVASDTILLSAVRDDNSGFVRYDSSTGVLGTLYV